MSRSLAERPVSVAYVGATLPTLSETFVSNELGAVRAAGTDVVAVSVYRPWEVSGDERLGALAAEAIVVYSFEGVVASIAEFLQHPIRTALTISMAARDAVRSRDVTVRSRCLCVPQALAAIGIAGRLRKRHVGHIHAHMANTPTTIAMYAATQLGIGFSFTGHANDLFVHRSLLPEKLARSNFVACISEWHRLIYAKYAKLPQSRMPVIRCGVATVEGDVLEAPPDGSVLRVLSVGRLVPKKGMDTLIRAIETLGAAFPVRCDIVGDGPMRAELESMVASAGLGDRVRLLGSLPNEEVLRLVRECEVFVLACRRDAVSGDQDGIPVSIMEAMGAGRCVITSDLAPVTELVIDGETGLCVPESNPAELAVAIRNSGTNVALRKQLSEAGRAHVRREFDRTVNAARLSTLFASCIEKVRGHLTTYQ